MSTLWWKPEYYSVPIWSPCSTLCSQVKRDPNLTNNRFACFQICQQRKRPFCRLGCPMSQLATIYIYTEASLRKVSSLTGINLLPLHLTEDPLLWLTHWWDPCLLRLARRHSITIETPRLSHNRVKPANSTLSFVTVLFHPTHSTRLRNY